MNIEWEIITSRISFEIFVIILQMTEVLKAGVLSDEIDLGALAHNAAEQAEEFVRKVSLFILND